MTPITFAPDAEPMTPGVMVDVTNLIPNKRGYQDAPQPAVLDTQQLAATPVNAKSFLLNSGAARIFVACSEGFYERASAGWIERVATDPSRTTSMRLMGDAVLATNLFMALQVSTSTTFAAVAGGPTARALVVTSTHQVMALGLLSPADGWACSAIADHTDWTAAAATQAATGRLLATPGKIVAGIEFGPHVVAFKEKSMYWMRYVNVPMIWATEVISNEIGCLGPEAVVDVGDRILFVGEDDIFSFDGTRPVAIGGPVKEWFFDRLYWEYRHLVQAIYDRRSDCVWWWYPTGTWPDVPKLPRNALVYHVGSGRWGTAQTAVGIAPMTIYADSHYGFQYEESFKPNSLGGITEEGYIFSQTERSAAATLRLGWMGDDALSPTLTKLRPRFLVKPATATATFYKSDDLETEVEGNTATFKEGAFGTQQNAHWHSAKLAMDAPFEITAISHDIPKPAAKR